MSEHDKLFTRSDGSRIEDLTETLEGPGGDILYEAKYKVNLDNTISKLASTWNSVYLQDLNEAPIGQQAGSVEGSGLAVAKFAWDIIKDGKPVPKSKDASSYVLSSKDTDPLNYVEAKRDRSGTYTWTIHDSLFTSLILAKIIVRAEGAYRAQPRSSSPAPSGYYLPSVYFNVLEHDVSWGHSLEGKVNLENPINVGTHDETNAEVTMHVKLGASNFFGSIGTTVAFRANGKTGFHYIGKG